MNTTFAYFTDCQQPNVCQTHRVTTGATLPIDWDVPEPDEPTAVCEVRGTPGDPGRFEFDGTASQNPGGGSLAYEWTFGDGASGAGSLTSHTYTVPGRFDATLRVASTTGGSDSTVCPAVDVAAPELGVGISFPDVGSALFAPGDSVPVRVSLSATEGVGDLTDVSFVGDPVDVAPDAALTLVSAPDPEDLPGPEGVTLAPGADPLTFDYEFEAAQPGAFTVSSSVTGTDAAGSTDRSRRGRTQWAGRCARRRP